MSELLPLFVRHQAGSAAATATDFAAMIALTSLVGLDPTLATALGAAAGGVVNFGLGRRWIFRSSIEPKRDQAIRYALVWLASVLLNTLGEHLLADRARIQYVVARLVVSSVVSIFWNFPMQRTFVFPLLGARQRE